VNDIADLDEDRRHPVKGKRPLAAGLVSIRNAVIIAIILMSISLTISFILGPIFGIVAISYFLLNLLYIFIVKKQVILDVFCISAGFILRVVGGTVAIDVVMSSWLLLCTGLLALFLGFAKRRHELVLLKENAVNHRSVLSEYNTYYLDQMILVLAATSFIVYVLFTMSAETIAKFGKGLIWTTTFVIYGIFRYQYLVYHKGSGGNPTKELLYDKPLMLTVFLWILTAILIIYLGAI
jgi:4-hydroxybenzoate polyprenyltransferase